MSFSKRGGSVPTDRMANATKPKRRDDKGLGRRESFEAERAAKAAQEDADSARYMKYGIIGTVVIFIAAFCIALPGMMEEKVKRVDSMPIQAANPLVGAMIGAQDRVVFYINDAVNKSTPSATAIAVRDACLPPLSRRGKRENIFGNDDWSETDLTSGDIDLHPHTIRANYRRAATYLVCAMKTQRERFCEPHHKAQIVDHIRTIAATHERYVDAWKTGTRFMAAMELHPIASVALENQRRVEDAVKGEGGGITSQSGRLPPKPEFPGFIADAISELSREGYLGSDDFYGSWLRRGKLPDDVKPLLVSGPAKRC